jgi:hypothetical protein
VAGAALAGIVVSLPVRASHLGALLVAIGGTGVLLLVPGLVFRVRSLVPWSLALAGGAYASLLFVKSGTIDPAAPLYGGALLLAAECAYWSLERPVPSGSPGMTSRRVAVIVMACVGGGGVGGLVLAISELSVSGGLGLEVLGVAAAVGAFTLIARLAHAGRDQP